MMGENPRHAELRMFRFQDLMTAFWTRRPLLGLLTHEPVVVPANNGTTGDSDMPLYISVFLVSPCLSLGKGTKGQQNTD